MKNRINPLIHIVLCVLSLILCSCTEEFLDIKPDKKQVVPASLKDLQAMLDNTEVMNTGMPTLHEIGSDDYYLKPESFQSIGTASQRNAYIWAPDIYEGSDNVNDWNWRYRQVFYANMVLEGLEKSTEKEKLTVQWKELKGSALFYRAWAYYQLAQLFCKPYEKSTAENDPGIPLRTESDINLTTKRVSVQETYNQILSDLETALELLPVEVTVKTRPSKAAALALLSRTNLQKGEYVRALEYALAALELNNTLIDYNTANATIPYPFARFNPEVIFHAAMSNPSNFATSRLNVDSNLLRIYHTDDLRSKLYFKNAGGLIGFKGSYDGSNTFFCGISTNELYLNVAECYARMGNAAEAVKTVNLLLAKRFTAGKFIGYSAGSAEEILGVILRERRKELLFRGLRWSDLRRLNKEQAFQVTLERVMNGTKYSLSPGDSRYVLPIPDLVIFLSGIQQNQR